MKYLVIDLETTIANRGEGSVGDFGGNPHHPKQRIVYIGMKRDNEDSHPLIHKTPSVDQCVNMINNCIEEDWCLVGQNIKFDLHYLMYHSKEIRDVLYNLRIWDTSVAEYILTGQQTKSAHLDDLSKKYGGTIKDSRMKEYWEAGVSTEDIPESEILPYLEQDVLNTEKVFLAQYKKAEQLGMLPLMWTQMDAVLATTEMEFNGMYFDIRKAHALAEEVSNHLDYVTGNIVDRMKKVGIEEPNPGSNEHISLLLFGGTQFVIKDRPVYKDGVAVQYKTGKRKGFVKTRKEKVANVISPFFGVTTPSTWLTNKPGICKTGDEILKTILKGEYPVVMQDVVNEILSYRELAKDLNTYYIGYTKLFWPHDQCIHGSLRHNQTNTGRLSSSKPNLQNLSN